MMISSDHVVELLEAGPEAVLVLIEGRAEVIGSDELGTDEYLGALEVISREALLDRTGGTDLTLHELEEQASTLDAMVSELGG